MKQFFNEYGGVTIVLVVIAVLLLLVGTTSVKADGTVEGNGVSGVITRFMTGVVEKLDMSNPTLDGNGGETPEVAKTTSMMLDGTSFKNKYLDWANSNGVYDSLTSLVFTDKIAPDGVSTTDFTMAQDGTVIGWMEGTTYYISSQISGTKILLNEDCNYMFNYGDADSMSFTSFNFGNVDTSQVIFMSCMFYNNPVETLDLSSFDTSNVTNMQQMFCECPNLKTITFGDGWDTSNVTAMDYMFTRCWNLTLDCSSWDVSNVTTYTDFNRSEYNSGPNISTITPPNWVN